LLLRQLTRMHHDKPQLCLCPLALAVLDLHQTVLVFAQMSTYDYTPISSIPTKLLYLARLPIKRQWALLTHPSQVAYGP
jgi:hypothetical protein